MSDERFERLVREHHRSVFAYARSMTRSDNLAEEATQDTFVKAWKHLDSFRGDGSLEGWLIRICRNCVYDISKRQSKGVVASLEPAVTAPDHQSELWSMIDMLSDDDREILVVCGALGYDYESASTLLDLPIGTVRSRLSRARARLSDVMQQAEAV